MVKVLVCANSTFELEKLEALVRSAPSLELVGSSLGRAGLSQLLADTQPEVLLERSVLDGLEELRLPDLNAKPVARVLVVAESEFPVTLPAIQAADSAFHGVLPGHASDREIQTAIEAVAEGLLVLHPDVAGHAAATSGSPPRASSASQQLSPRETEVLNLVAAGLGNKEIAWRLKISEHTVKFHVTSIFNKLNTSSRAEAVAVGLRRGLIVL